MGISELHSWPRPSSRNRAYNEGQDASFEELVDHIRVELDAFGVHRVVSATQGDDTRPSDREAVRLDAILLEKSNIFPPQTIRVGRDVAVFAVQSLSWSPREIVPNGLASAVNVYRPLDLEACCC